MDMPRVSVVTPFYNTSSYLRQCIESVLKQTFVDWEYVLVDNCSDDGSGQIARSFANLDGRVRLMSTPRFFTQVQNYNFALRQISDKSTYCILVQADDRILPTCLERMVRVGDAHADVGVVTSYHMEGAVVRGGPIALEESVLDGREVCRRTLSGQLSVFGSPTTVMYRASVIRAQEEEFFDGGRLHEDTDALFRTLMEWKLGFVHEILSFVRVDNASISSAVRDYDPFVLDRFLRVRLYADKVLAKEEADSLKRTAEYEYLRHVAARMVEGGGKEYWNYHRKGLRTASYELSMGRVAAFGLLEVAGWIGNPLKSAVAIIRRLGGAVH